MPRLCWSPPTHPPGYFPLALASSLENPVMAHWGGEDRRKQDGLEKMAMPLSYIANESLQIHHSVLLPLRSNDAQGPPSNSIILHQQL